MKSSLVESEPIKVLVTGGRNFSDHDFLNSFLDNFLSTNPIKLLIHGDASGVDTLAKNWAIKNNILHKPYPANWTDFSSPCIIKYGQFGKYNALAGNKRNKFMLEDSKPDLVIAFPGGSGTKDMVKISKKNGVPVIFALDKLS